MSSRIQQVANKLNLFSINEMEKSKLMKDLSINDSQLNELFELYKIEPNTESIDFGLYRCLFEKKNPALIELILKFNSNHDFSKAFGDYYFHLLENILQDEAAEDEPNYDTEKTFELLLTIFKFLLTKSKELSIEKVFSSKTMLEQKLPKLACRILSHQWPNSIRILLDESIIKCNDSLSIRYGDFFLGILEKILKDDNYGEFNYDTEKTFEFILEIFKSLFHKDFINHFKCFKIDKIKNNIKNDDLKLCIAEYFNQEKYKEFLIEKIFSTKTKLDEMFTNLAHKVLDKKWPNAIRIFFDACFIELDKDVTFFILSPLESTIALTKHNSRIEPTQTKSESKEERESLWHHYYKSNHPLYTIRQLDDESILGHKLVCMSIYDQWRNLGWLIHGFEYFIYVAFIVFYSLNSLRLFKDYDMPDYFKYITLALIVIILIYETSEMVCLKFYYFISFTSYLEWFNMIFCLIAIFSPDPTIKTSFYSLSILFSYLFLIFRSDITLLLGVYTYTFRKILLKSLRIVPLVIILFLAFFFAFKIRSRFITNLGNEHDKREMSVMDSYLSNGLVQLSLMFMGNINIGDMGLGPQGATTENAINYILTDLFIFLMPVFLFNLFIGIAVGEVTDTIKKGEYHVLKVSIDFFLRFFYLYPLLKFLKLERAFNYNYNKYLWKIPKHRRGVRKIGHKIGKIVWMLKEKLANTQWTIDYNLCLEEIADISIDSHGPKNSNKNLEIIELE
jgi:hypothetical protein